MACLRRRDLAGAHLPICVLTLFSWRFKVRCSCFAACALVQWLTENPEKVTIVRSFAAFPVFGAV